MIYHILAVLLLLVLVVALIDVRYAISLVFAVMLLIPPEIKFNLGYINLNSFNLLVAILLAGIFLMIVKRRGAYGLKIKRLKHALYGWLLYVIVTSFVASIGDIPIGEYVKNMVLFFLEYLCIAFCMMYMQMDGKSIRFFDTTLVIVSTVVIVYGFVNYAIGFNPYMSYVSNVADMDVDMSNTFMLESRGALAMRCSSVFIHPLQLGQCAVLLLSYVLFQFRGKVYITLALGLAAMAVLSGSRSAILPMLMAFAFYAIRYGAKKAVIYTIAGGVVMLLIFSQLPHEVKETAKALTSLNDKTAARTGIVGSSVEGRLGQYETAVDVISGREFFGYGFGHVKNHGDEHPAMLGYESLVLYFLVDGGYVGLLAFLLFYFTLYDILRKVAHRQEEKSRVDALCLCFFVNILLTGISYSFFSFFLILYFMTYYNIILKDSR